MKAEEIDSATAGASDAGYSHVGDLSDLIVGGNVRVPVLDGSLRPYINLDNAASTPIARPVSSSTRPLLTGSVPRRYKSVVPTGSPSRRAPGAPGTSSPSKHQHRRGG